jgi:hypothetical protein
MWELKSLSTDSTISFSVDALMVECKLSRRGVHTDMTMSHGHFRDMAQRIIEEDMIFEMGNNTMDSLQGKIVSTGVLMKYNSICDCLRVDCIKGDAVVMEYKVVTELSELDNVVKSIVNAIDYLDLPSRCLRDIGECD